MIPASSVTELDRSISRMGPNLPLQTGLLLKLTLGARQRRFARLAAALGDFPRIARQRKAPLAHQMHAPIGLDRQYAHGQAAQAHHGIFPGAAIGADDVIFLDVEPIVLERDARGRHDHGLPSSSQASVMSAIV